MVQFLLSLYLKKCIFKLKAYQKETFGKVTYHACVVIQYCGTRYRFTGSSSINITFVFRMVLCVICMFCNVNFISTI